MGKLGNVRQIAAKDMDWYVTNMSYNELAYKAEDNKNMFPTNSLVICAYNKSTNDVLIDDENYAIAAIDYEGNICPITMFDKIGNGLNTETKENNRFLKVNIGSGLSFDKNGSIVVDVNTINKSIENKITEYNTQIYGTIDDKIEQVKPKEQYNTETVLKKLESAQLDGIEIEANKMSINKEWLVTQVKSIILGNNVKVSEVSMPTYIEKMYVGDVTAILYSIIPYNATNKNVKWLVDDINVISIDSFGKITAISTGMATLTVFSDDGNKSAKRIYEVIEKPKDELATLLELTKEEITLIETQTEQLGVEVKPILLGDSVKWTSTNSWVAAVDDTGLVTANNGGETIIRATCGGLTAECKVIVEGVTYQLTYSLTESSGFVVEDAIATVIPICQHRMIEHANSTWTLNYRLTTLKLVSNNPLIKPTNINWDKSEFERLLARTSDTKLFLPNFSGGAGSNQITVGFESQVFKAELYQPTRLSVPLHVTFTDHKHTKRTLTSTFIYLLVR